MAVTRDGALSVKSTGTGAAVITTSSITDGSWMVLCANAGNTSVTLTTPSGWTQLVAATTIGSRRFTIWGKIKDSGDASVSVAKSGSLAMSMGLEYGSGSDPVADWQVGSVFVRSSGTGTDDLIVTCPSITTLEANVFALGIACEATSAEDTVAPVVSGTGWTAGSYVSDTVAPDVTDIQQINFGYKTVASAGASGDMTVTYQQTQNVNAGGVQIGITPAAPSNSAPTAAFTFDEDGLSVDVDGTTSTDSDGTISTYSWDWGDGSSDDTGSTQTHTYASAGTYTITLTVTDDDGATDTQTHDVDAVAPPVLFIGDDEISEIYIGDQKVSAIYIGDTLVKRWGYTVDEFLSGSPVYIAHRGLGDTYPEQSMAGYDAAVAAGFQALEASLHVTSDGVFVLSHDSTTNRVFGVSYTISAQTWATLSSLNSATGPILRLEDLLDKYGSTHVIFLDDKTNANTAALLALVDTYPDPTQHFIWKGFRGWSPAADIWTAAGYESWGIYYDAEIGTTGSPHSSVSHFSTLGLNWDATQTNWDVAIATGKRTFAHVIYQDSDRTTGLGKGATGFMISGVDALP